MEIVQDQMSKFHLLYLSTFDKLRPDLSQFQRNLRSLRDAHPLGDTESLGRLMGVSEDVVRKWMTGRRKPKLGSLFKLQEVLGLSGIHQLFYQEQNFLRKVLLEKNYSLRFDARPKHKEYENEHEIRSFIHAMLEGKEVALSRSQLAKKFFVSEGWLKYRYDLELKELSVLHLARLVDEKERRDKDTDVIIDRAVSQTLSRARDTTIENILSEVPVERIHYVEDLTDLQLTMSILKARHKRGDVNRFGITYDWELDVDDLDSF
ncbi:MAG: helix-turn-helix transcriptional regulator [Halioglobus sp.]